MSGSIEAGHLLFKNKNNGGEVAARRNKNRNLLNFCLIILKVFSIMTMSYWWIVVHLCGTHLSENESEEKL